MRGFGGSVLTQVLHQVRAELGRVLLTIVGLLHLTLRLVVELCLLVANFLGRFVIARVPPVVQEETSARLLLRLGRRYGTLSPGLVTKTFLQARRLFDSGIELLLRNSELVLDFLVGLLLFSSEFLLKPPLSLGLPRSSLLVGKQFAHCGGFLLFLV